MTVSQKDAMRHAQKAIELDLPIAAVELCTKTSDDADGTDTLFVGIIEAAQQIQIMCRSDRRDSARENAESKGQLVPPSGKPTPRKRRKSDAQPLATPTTSRKATPCAVPESEIGSTSLEAQPRRLELSGQQRRLARLAAVEAERCAAVKHAATG